MLLASLVRSVGTIPRDRTRSGTGRDRFFSQKDQLFLNCGLGWNRTGREQTGRGGTRFFKGSRDCTNTLLVCLKRLLRGSPPPLPSLLPIQPLHQLFCRFIFSLVKKRWSGLWTKSSFAYCSHEQFLSAKRLLSIRTVKPDNLKNGADLMKMILKSVCDITSQYSWKIEIFS